MRATPIELIKAYVEGYRGSCDAPGYEACVEAEINNRLNELEQELTYWKTRATTAEAELRLRDIQTAINGRNGL